MDEAPDNLRRVTCYSAPSLPDWAGGAGASEYSQKEDLSRLGEAETHEQDMAPSRRRGWKERIREAEYHHGGSDQVEQANTDGSRRRSVSGALLVG